MESQRGKHEIREPKRRRRPASYPVSLHTRGKGAAEVS